MNSTILILLAIGLFVAWIIGPAIFLHYRITVVPRRYKEIRDRFMSDNPTESLATQDDRQQTGAWHYARLLDPDVQLSKPDDPELILQREFWHYHGWRQYWLPFGFVVVLSALMLAFSGLWLADQFQPCDSKPLVGKPAAQADAPDSADAKIAAKSDAAPKSTPPTKGVAPATSVQTKPAIIKAGSVPAPFVMALWGAYVWSLYEILIRRKSGDLTPVELYDIAIRYVIAIPLGYAFSLLVFDTVPSLAAFSISAFPLRDIRQLIRKNALNKLEDKLSPANSAATSSIATKGYLAETLSGMGNTTIARLEELNIETYLDLAYADPVKLLIKTGVPIELVLSWIDQAMVSVYAAPHKAELANYGMPCALDLCEFYARHCWDVAANDFKPTWETDPAVHALATKLTMPEVFLVKQILRSVFEDPHTKFLVRVWFGPARSPESL